MLHRFKLTQMGGSAGWSPRFSEGVKFPAFDKEEKLRGRLTDCVKREAKQNLEEGETPGDATILDCDVAVKISSSTSEAESEQDSSGWEDIDEQESSGREDVEPVKPRVQAKHVVVVERKKIHYGWCEEWWDGK